MRLLRLLSFVFLVLPSLSQAQVSLQLQMPRESFLLYEAVPVSLTIRNVSGRPVSLRDSADMGWLQFLIHDTDGVQVPVIGKFRLEPLTLGPAQSVTRTFDLLPLYDLRSRGAYRVRASVRPSGVAVISAPVLFHIVTGREVWSETVALAGETNAPSEYRTFSLVTRRDPRYETLYVGVKDLSNATVYGMLPLGMCIGTMDLEARVDKDAHLHVLYRNAPHSFGYVEIASDAKAVHYEGYTEWLSKPCLSTSTGGVVSVVGGEKGGIPPPVPVPEMTKGSSKNKTKKWWWPFGK